ncbi:MAG TPA: 4-demethylwyosine synthase TYW1, partial [Thermoplasmatales archaeon]|nr:4-demethylwyosine synthase TYW1 [Thermoplasmatales archaeon]HEX08309.1 4-demethylwyosine synthase TYW1 [Thermoplasmatales archaeon]
LDTRTVIRHTLVDGWNIDGYEKEYAKLDEKAEPWFIEPKGFVLVGSSRNRLTIKNMPTHSKIREFSRRLAEHLGYEIYGEREDSRVILLTRDKKNVKIK